MDEMTPLTVAAWQGDSAVVATLLHNGASVNDDQTGVTALDIAVFKNDTNTAAVLIAEKANVNHLDKLGYTPLHWAANIDFGDTQMLELLLRANADAKLRSREGLTPLQIATKYQHTRHEKVLKNTGR
jgi:ankyrin repeat protein